MAKEESKKVLATKNTAKDVVQPKMKTIRVNPQAAAEISRMSGKLDSFIAGTVAGMGIKGPWQFDIRKMSIIVPE
jgi:hypothetical protein